MRTGWALIVLLVIGAAACVDVAIGYWRDTGDIREQARQFRSEAAPLKISSQSLRPGLNHSYNTLEDTVELRKLRTGMDGTISSPHPPLDFDHTILFLGGSTTECNEVVEASRFPAVVEQHLRDHGIKVRAINAGVRGNTTLDSINAFLNRKDFNTADYVVLMHNINDRLKIATWGDYQSPLNRNAPTTFYAVQDSARDLLFTTWDFLSYRSNSLFALRSANSSFNAWAGDDQDGISVNESTIDFGTERAIAGVSKFENNLIAFVALVRAYGRTPVLMTQALGRKSKGQSAFNAVIRKVAGAQNVILIDLESELGGTPHWAFLDDDIHFNNVGSVATGEIISNALSSVLQK